jgi:hypothetical protein
VQVQVLSPAPPVPSSGRFTASQRLGVWAALQAGGLVTLLAGFALVATARMLLGSGTDFLGPDLLRKWGMAFVLVPVTFVPVLVLWHKWALARYGRRGAFFRFVAEVAFAAELIGCVLYQRLA